MDLIPCERYLADVSTSQRESDLKEFIDKVNSRKRKREVTLQEDNVQGASSSASSVLTCSAGEVVESELTQGKNKCKEISSKKSKRRDKHPSHLDATFHEGVSSDGKASLKTPVQKDPRKKRKKKKTIKPGKTKNQEVADWSIPTKEEEGDVKYQVLGNYEFRNKSKVKRVLPRWLAEPKIISDDVNCSEESICVTTLKYLTAKLKKNMQDNQLERLFPVQSAVIPHLLSDIRKESSLWARDICVSAPTGSGKTLAYVIPLLQAKSALIFNVLHGLVIVPVQELAIQVTCVFRMYAKRTNISIGCATGGMDYQAEAKNLIKKKPDGTLCSAVDILVATPGRLVEHMLNTEGFTLKHLKYIVIDEADRIMEQRSLNWLHLLEKQYDKEHLGAVPPASVHNLQHYKRRPQKWLFSATLSQDPEKLLQLNLFQPKLFTSVKKDSADGADKGRFLGKFTVPSNVTEYYIECQSAVKPLILVELIRQKGWTHIMCFTKSCEEARRLSALLGILMPSLEVAQVTTLLPLREREKSLEALAAGCVDLLVCSDRVARGMDIPGVDYVILYDPPKYAKGYVHRIGRTGRAGAAGTALTLVTPPQCKHFFEILTAVSHPVPQVLELDQSNLDEDSLAYQNALTTLAITLQKEHAAKIRITKLEKRKGMVIGSSLSSKRPKTSS